MQGDVLVERAGPLAWVRLFNPDKLNALNAAMWRRLTQVMHTLSADETLRCVLVRGEGDNFAAGGDIEEFLVERSTPAQAARYHGQWVADALRAVAECRHPTVAAIQGACVGGGLEIAAACDLRIGAKSARLGAPIGKLGFSMYPGELAAVLAVAGPATTLEILLEGRLLDAREALQKGLLTRVVDDAALFAEAGACAQRIAAGAPRVARAHKALLRRLAAGAAAQDDPFWYLSSPDYAEGMRAFGEKRAPVFSGQ